MMSSTVPSDYLNEHCNMITVRDIATGPTHHQTSDTRSRFGRWFSRFICGGSSRSALYGSPNAYHPVNTSRAPLSRRVRHRQSLQAVAPVKGPQVLRSVTFDGPKTSAHTSVYVPPISNFPRRSNTTVQRHAEPSFFKSARSASIMNSERNTSTRSQDRAPRHCNKEGRSQGQLETREILRSMAKLADKRRLAGQHVYRHGRLVCTGLSKKDLDRAKIRVLLGRSYPWLATNCTGSITGSSGRTATTTTPGGSFLDYASPFITTRARPTQKRGVMVGGIEKKTYDYPKLSGDVIGVGEMTLEEFERGFYRRNTM
ncbi:hypothetical protein Pmar_PMAR006501 [Perkinsus marinus ATCC 50983]|uniref:Uncharacterized protein n=1 Tax=Perkinsus marinus (strain ATCC 50983 / TXsc) TaxID=423536 RepID=C5K9V5_PERM5|nr:hypothetical protein Pmar_PMAR006501 [Perkinsus marinus ATCC 50983]EER18877.1 hypothetical protein Pmar_PMAR006501 [Perkinsus marinus ATCC 50983]|eukprot:XP_002787081.1 hypothetical protein Pmar_PMAR006501 [Perkinsus marinus ATCC 50983]